MVVHQTNEALTDTERCNVCYPFKVRRVRDVGGMGIWLALNYHKKIKNKVNIWRLCCNWC